MRRYSLFGFRMGRHGLTATVLMAVTGAVAAGAPLAERVETVKAEVLGLLPAVVRATPEQGDAISIHAGVEADGFLIERAELSMAGERLGTHTYDTREARALLDGGWHRLARLPVAATARTLDAKLVGRFAGRDAPVALEYRVALPAGGDATAVLLPVTQEEHIISSEERGSSVGMSLVETRARAGAPRWYRRDPSAPDAAATVLHVARYRVATGQALAAWIALSGVADTAVAQRDDYRLVLAEAGVALDLLDTARAALDGVDGEADPRRRHAVEMALAAALLERDRAAVALARLDRLPPPAEAAARAERDALRGRLLLAVERPDAAVDVLRRAAGHDDDAFATYNLGIAELRAGRIADGLATLRRVGRADRDTDVERYLADRANLLLGQRHLDARDFGAAHRALERIGLAGPYGNRGLLAMGWVALSRPDAVGGTGGRLLDLLPWRQGSDPGAVAVGQMRAALDYWDALAAGDPLDPVVQEGMLGSAYLLGQIGEETRASGRYRDTVAALESALDAIDGDLAAFDHQRFLDTMAATGEPGRMGRDWHARGLPDLRLTDWSTELLAGATFQRDLRTYRDIGVLQTLLSAIDRAGAGDRPQREALRTRLAELRDEQARVVRTRALDHLRDRRERIAAHLARARFALARSVDVGLATGAATQNGR